MTQEIGIAKAVQGQMTASGPEGTHGLHQGSPVFKGDTISTAKGSAGSIEFLDHSVLNVGEASKVSLDQYVYDASKGTGKVLFKMAQGTFRAVTGEIVKNNPESFKLQSPLATIGIRGTETAHTIPPEGEGSETHLVMIFDGKPVIVQPLAGGGFQVLSQGGVKVEVGKFGAGPVLVMTPQEYKYYQALTQTGIQQGAPTDTISTSQGTSVVKDAQTAAIKAAADSAAKAAAETAAKAAAEAAAKAAADAAKGTDPAAKAAADAAAKAAAEAAAKAGLEAKAAADLAAKAAAEAAAALQAQAMVLAAKAAAELAAQQAQQQGQHTTELILSENQVIHLSDITGQQGQGQGQGTGSGLLYSHGAADVIDHSTPPPVTDTTPPPLTPTTATLDLSTGAPVSPFITSAAFSVVKLSNQGDSATVGHDAMGVSVTGGAGNDSVTYIASGSVTGTIDGGGGDNTLAAGANTTIDFTAATILNIQNVSLGSGSTGTFTAAQIDYGYQGGDGYPAHSSSVSTLTGTGLSVNGATFIVKDPGSAWYYDFSHTTFANWGSADVLDITGSSTYSNLYNMGANMASYVHIHGAGGTLEFIPNSDVPHALDNVSDINTLIFGDFTGSVSLSALPDLHHGSTLTIDTTSMTAQAGGTLTLDASNVTVAGLDYHAGAGADHITGTNQNDTFTFGTHLTSDDHIDGKCGDNTLNFAADSSTQSNVLANVSNMQHVNILGNGDSTMSGGVHLDLPEGIVNNDGTLHLDAHLLGRSLTLDATALAAKLDFTGGTESDSIDRGTHLTSADTLTGGGGSDTLHYVDNSALDNQLAHVSGFSSIVFDNTTTSAYEKLVGNASVPSGGLTVDASNIDSSHSLTFDASGVTASYLYLDITGGAGADTLIGGAGGNHFHGSMGNDSITGGSGTDTLDYSSFNADHQIHVTYSAADAGSATFSGGTQTFSGIEILKGGTVNDTFDLGTHLSSAVTIWGGQGDDTLNFTQSQTGDHTGDLSGIHEVENFHLGDANTSLIITDAVAQTLVGDLGHISIDGSDLGTGDSGLHTLSFNAADVSTSYAFKITGGAGDDHFAMGTNMTSADTIDGGGGSNYLSFTQHAQGSNPDSPYELLQTHDLDHVTNIDHILLGDAATSLKPSSSFVANATDNILHVDAHALTQNFTWDGSNLSCIPEVDLKLGTAGTQHIDAGNVNTRYYVDASNLTLAGTDHIYASLYGAGGALTVGATADTHALDGVSGFGTIVFKDSAHIIGHDLLTDNSPDHQLTLDGSGLSGDQHLNFNGSDISSGSLNILGGAGADTLTGGAGDDTLTANGDNDILHGGEGHDTYVFSAADNNSHAMVVDASTLAMTTIQVSGTTDLSHVSFALPSTGSVNLALDPGANVTMDAGLLTLAQSIEALNVVTYHHFYVTGSTGTVETVTFNGTGGNDVLNASYLTLPTSGDGGMGTWETQDALILNGLAGDDTITGNAIGCVIEGGAGADVISLTGESHDVVIYRSGDVVAGESLLNASGFTTIEVFGTGATDFTVAPDVKGFGTLHVEDDGAVVKFGAGQLANLGEIDFHHGAIPAAETVEVYLDSVSHDLDLHSVSFVNNTAGDKIVYYDTASSGSLSGTDKGDEYHFTQLNSAVAVHGGTGDDTLYFTQQPIDQGHMTPEGDLNGVSNVETIVLGNTTTDVSLTISDTVAKTLVGTLGHITIDAHALTTGVLTFDSHDVGADYGFYITGGNGGDLFSMGAGANNIHGGTGNDTFIGISGHDSFYGGLGDDHFTMATDGVNTLTANCIIDGGDSGHGLNTLDYWTQGQANTLAPTDWDGVTNIEHINIHGYNAVSITATDHLCTTGQTLTIDATGHSGAPFIFGGALVTGALSITGNDYGNILTGGSGDDKLTGGLGDDVFHGRGGNNVIDGGSHDVTGDTVSYSDATSAVTAHLDTGIVDDNGYGGTHHTDTLSNIQNYIGSNHGDTVTFGADTQLVDCGSGNDTVDGGSYLHAEMPGAHGGAGEDTLHLDNSAGPQSALGVVDGFEHIVLDGDHANLTVGNTLFANVSNTSDPLTHWNSMDMYHTISVDASALTGTGGLTFDAHDVTGGYLYIHGSEQGDTITGCITGSNTSAGDFSNKIFGGGGNDTLTGAPSAPDMFIYKSQSDFGTTGDIITNFTSGTDKLAFYDNSHGGNFGFTDTASAQPHVYGSVADYNSSTAGPNLGMYDSSGPCLYFDNSTSQHQLMYDQDGHGTTYTAQVVATLTNVTSIVAADVHIVNDSHIAVGLPPA